MRVVKGFWQVEWRRFNELTTEVLDDEVLNGWDNLWKANGTSTGDVVIVSAHTMLTLSGRMHLRTTSFWNMFSRLSHSPGR